MGDFQIQGTNLNTNIGLNKKELEQMGLNKTNYFNKLQTLFDKLDVDIKLDDGLNAKETNELLGLFDTDNNKDIAHKELSYENLELFVAENAGGKYTRDGETMNPFMALISAIERKIITGTVNNTTIGDAITKETIITKDANGEINGGFNLETIGGVTTKTMFAIDGTENKSTTEKWEAEFKNYEKVWTSPSGEKSILKAAGDVIANPNGTFFVPVKREGIGASDEILTLILDKNGNEIGRFDGNGNTYDSTGVMTKKSFKTFDKNGNTTGGYELDLTGDMTKKIRYNSDGSVDNRCDEQWGDKFQNYRKEWTGPNGEKTVLEYTNSIDNGDGTYSVTVKRTDSRYPDKIFTILMDENGKELDRIDEDGNHYDSTGALREAVDTAPQAKLIAAKGAAKSKASVALDEDKTALPKEGNNTATGKGLKKAGMYWAKTETVNGQIIKTIYYDEAGTRTHSRTIENDTSAGNPKMTEFYNENGDRTHVRKDK